MMPWRNIAGLPTLLEELLDHAQGDAEPVRHLGTRSFIVVVRNQDSFTQVQGYCSHPQNLPYPRNNGYTFY